MKANIIAFALLAVGMPLLPTHALSAQDAAPAAAEEWRRVVVANQALAVSMPCSEDDIKKLNSDEYSGLACSINGMYLAVMVGSLENALGIKNFNKSLLEARADPETERVVEISVAGHRAFEATGRTPGPVRLAKIVDMGERSQIMLAALEQAEGGIAAGDRKVAVDRARRFIDSLELLSK